MTSVNWHWLGWNDFHEHEFVQEENLALCFGGVGKAEENEIMVFDPKTGDQFPEVVTQQFSYQQMLYWNHTRGQGLLKTLSGSEDLEFEDPDNFGPKWEVMAPQCYYINNFGKRVIFDCTEADTAYFVPSKRIGHSFVTLNTRKDMIVYGGYSTICADYCNDLWHFNLDTRIWTFLNMSNVPSPRYLDEIEYTQLYGLDVPPQEYVMTGPTPSKRWQHCMCPMGDKGIIMHGGYYSENKVYKFLDDVWIYSLDILPTPSNPSRYGENKALWSYANDTYWGTQPGTKRPHGRRAHVCAYINRKLYVHGGQVFTGTSITVMDGRESKSRSSIMGDLWEWDSSDNQWREITPISLDGRPMPRYMHSFYQFEDSLVIQGGYDDPRYYDDMWSFNATSFSWTHVTYEHRNFLVYNPRPHVRYGHSMARVGDSFLFFGGYGQACVDEPMGTGDLNLLDDADEDSRNFFCMPDLIKNKDGSATWFNDITGAIETDPSKFNAGATRFTTVPLYFADTWVFNHSRCPEDCHHSGRCHLNFCVCEHHMPGTCNSHHCVRETFWGSFVVGTNAGRWGYHCGFNMCHNSSCYYNFTHQHEYCRHCQYHGDCEGFSGLCHCHAKYQHILPLHYQETAISPYGPKRADGTRAMTTEPVAFYAEAEDFHLDPRRRKDCQYTKCPHQFCSGHGYCMKDGRCHCHPEYIGTGCEYHAYCPLFCNYQGTCLPKLRDATKPWEFSRGGKCQCHDVFNGTRCEIALRNAASSLSPMGFSTQVLYAVLVTSFTFLNNFWYI